MGTTTTVTTYVGSLFETDNKGRSTKYIFLGDQRIASITQSPTLISNVLYYHADHLGGANVLIDANGLKKELIEYEPFGQESRHEKYSSVSSEEIAWYYFTGKPKDDETGLIFFGARYYDPALGRFITSDSIVQDPTNSQTLNRYSYVSNNPVNRIDPTGHSWKSFWKGFKKAASWMLGGVLLHNQVEQAFEGNWKPLAGAVVGIAVGVVTAGWASAYLAPAMAGWLAGGAAVTAGQAAFITATEFAISGAAAGFAGTLAGGGSLANAGRAAGMGFGIGSVTGGIIGYTYASGMQSFAHGFDAKAYNTKIAQEALAKGDIATWADAANKLAKMGAPIPQGPVEPFLEKYGATLTRTENGYSISVPNSITDSLQGAKISIPGGTVLNVSQTDNFAWSVSSSNPITLTKWIGPVPISGQLTQVTLVYNTPMSQFHVTSSNISNWSMVGPLKENNFYWPFK